MKRTTQLSALGAVLSLCLVACGDSDGTTADSKDSSTSDSTAAASSNPAVAPAQEELDQYMVKPAFEAPGPAWMLARWLAKTIAMVVIDQSVPSLQVLAESVDEAAAEVGLKTTTFDGKSNPSAMATGVEQAIAADVSAIVLIGIPTQLIASQLEKAADADIPVISSSNGNSTEPSPGGIFANSAVDGELSGRLVADAAIVSTNGEAKALIIGIDGIDPAAEIMQGMTTGMEACETCSLEEPEMIQMQDLFTTLTTQTTSWAQSYPDVNVMLPLYVTQAVVMVPGLQQAGAADRIKLFSTGLPDDAAKVLANTPSMGGMVGFSEKQLGWYALDQALRGMLDMEPGSGMVPLRYITADTVDAEGTTQDELYGSDYRDGFLQLWGAS